MNCLLTASVKDERRPWPRMATKVINASPIINAAAVDAVRVGLRLALARARVPRGVVGGEGPRRSGDMRAGRAEDGDQRPHEPWGDERDADEEQDRAEA